MIEKQGKVIKLTPKQDEGTAKMKEIDQKRKGGKKLTIEDLYDQQQLIFTELSDIRKWLQKG